MDNYTFFGTVEHEYQKPIPSRKFKTMQEIHGTIEGKSCKTCVYLDKWDWGNGKNYYKCQLWHQSNSAATDIRLKNIACKKYIEGGNN